MVRKTHECDAGMTRPVAIIRSRVRGLGAGESCRHSPGARRQNVPAWRLR
jgi:hypothetical protein